MPHLRLLCLYFLLPALQNAATGQATFHLKIDSLYSAYGLAVLPDGGAVLGGSRADCVQLLRFSPDGAVLWTKKICPQKLSVDFEHGSVRIVPGVVNGEFYVAFRKSSPAAGDNHVLNLLRFDPAGNLLWECQLPPYVSFGNFSSGSQLAVASDGTVWAVHGIGDVMFTGGQSFNQVLLFKISPAGELQLRSSYKTAQQSTANGVFVRTDDEIYVYGGLGYSIGDGFLLKINGGGAVQWAKQYHDFFFYRDGGRFANGDLLLYGQGKDGIVFARVRLDDGAIVWLKNLAGNPASGPYTVAADQGIFAAVQIPGIAMPTAVARFSPDAETLEWMHSYEDCTDFLLLNLLPTADKGLIFSQDGNQGAVRTRLLKVDAQGQFSSACPAWPQALPAIENLVATVADLDFTRTDGPVPLPETLSVIVPFEAQAEIFCPALYPEAAFSLPDSLCADSPLQLVASGNAVADGWDWIMPGAMPPAEQGPRVENVRYPEAGYFPVTLIQRFGHCTDTLRDTIRVVQALAGGLFGFRDTLHCPDTPFLALPLPANFDAWQWDDGSTGLSRRFDPPRAGTFRLTVQKGLCSATDSFTIRLARCAAESAFVPNAFSPDGDATNGVWTISLLDGYTLLSCSVYDRWGNLLYETPAGELPHWDGTQRGKKLPAGVYWWIVSLRDADGKEEQLAGDVTLIR